MCRWLESGVMGTIVIADCGGDSDMLTVSVCVEMS